MTVGRFFIAAFIIGTSAASATAQPFDEPQPPEPPRPVYIIDLAGGPPRQVTPDDTRICGSPDWSPDGKAIAYDTWQVGETYVHAHIYIVSPDGTNDHELVRGNMPSWSPDGSQIVYFTYGGSPGQYGYPITIDVINTDGTGREVILNHWGCPRWMPSGNQIATISNDRTVGILDLNTGIERSTFRGPYQLVVGLDVSSDGKQFCFSLEGGGMAVATLDERTVQCTVRPIIAAGVCHQCSFSPDGKRIVVSWHPPGAERAQIYIVDTAGNSPPELIPGQQSANNNMCPDWSPDGKAIAYVSQP